MAELRDVAPGVRRVSWTREEQEVSFERTAEDVRRAVAEALRDGAVRVETHVDPGDPLAQRVATWSGLRREGVARAASRPEGGHADRVVYARLEDDVPLEEPMGFRSLLNSFLPRKRAIAQMLIRSADGRVLVCQLTYKRDWDLPGGVVEVGESPALAVAREVGEELALDIPAGPLVLTDWMPPWGGWDDAVCLVFDGGVHDPSITRSITRQVREIRSTAFLTPAQVREQCADFTARRIEAALRNLGEDPGPAYVESGRPVGP